MDRGVLVVFPAFIPLQFVPHGWDHPNPALRDAPTGPTKDVEQLAKRACHDCHSHQTNRAEDAVQAAIAAVAIPEDLWCESPAALAVFKEKPA